MNNKPNSGKLFKNEQKEPGSNQPDYTGPHTGPNGEKMRIAAWLYPSKHDGGDAYFSYQISEERSRKPRDSYHEEQGTPF